MGTHKSRTESVQHLRQLRRQFNQLNASPVVDQRLRTELLRDIRLAKGSLRQTSKSNKSSTTKAAGKRKPSARTKPAVKQPAATTKKKSNLSDILSPKNIQESLKTVGSLRSTVKNWMQYLQQADQVLDTLYVTSNSLKESGVLDKLMKEKGKNLTTEDFTNVLIALMNSPLGNQVFGGGKDHAGEASGESAGDAAQ